MELEPHPSGAKVYGPYVSSDRVRRIVILEFPDGTRKTQSNARYLLERKLQRTLGPEEEADHIDDDPSNDDPENLQVLTPLENLRKSARQVEWMVFRCPVCGIEATKRAKDVRANRRKGKAGPYCSRKCAGLAHH